jgi:hypothetical protein|mmetsp:Transcript_7498/g.33901  ORF Transcript_7498/g.33901 Transcript_7498/m.33901 type:complete len:327 (+) Transcript_7498:140-1120(+)
MTFLVTDLLRILCLLYLANILLHAKAFAKRNPVRRPRRQNVVLLLFRILFGMPVNVVVGCWLSVWIGVWECFRQPLWKPTNLTTADNCSASVSLCGGGFRTWYHLGIYWGLYEYLGLDVLQRLKLSGASIGALVATVAACGIHPADIWAHIPAIAEAYRNAFFGHATTVGQFCRYLLHATLPEDAHLSVRGRLYISISSLLPVPHNTLISEFASREDLINAVIAAQYIPTWTFPGLCIYRKQICVDGGVTNNLPALSKESLRIGLDIDDIRSWKADLVPSQPLARINTFLPANGTDLKRMLDCGKMDIIAWFKTTRGRKFIEASRT